MVFYDTENTNKSFKGMLYISLMDVDYLVDKYGIDNLKMDVPNDYVEYMEEELERIKNNEPFDIAYYGALQMGIQTEEDEKLLEILKKEVQEGNLFSKKQLTKLKKEELDLLINELFRHSELSNEELYKLRSYQMVEYIIDKIKEAKDIEISGYEEGNFNYNKYKTITNNLHAIGLASNVKESNYFDVEVLNNNK